MKKLLMGLILTFVFFVPQSTQALFGPTIRAERKEINEDRKELRAENKELKQSLKGKGIKIVNGVVTVKSGSTLTVAKDGRTYIVNTDSNTKFRRHFWGKSSLADILVDDRVNVWGKFTNEATNTLLATMIRDLSILKRRGAFMGTILSKSADSFVMSTLERGNQTVTTNSATKFVKRNEQTMTFADLQVGDKVRVKGVWNKTLSTITEVTQVKDFSQPVKPSPTPTP